MKLTDLNPSWVGAGGEGVTRNGQPVPKRHGVGVQFDCPCGCEMPCYVAFANPLDGGAPYTDPGQPAWQRAGETFETLTLTPSILRARDKGGCGWHGFITYGAVTSC